MLFGCENCLIWSYVCFIRALRRFQQSFSHIATVSGCGRELKAHCLECSLTEIFDMIFHPVTLYLADQFWFPALLSWCRAQNERAANTFLTSLVWLSRGSNPQPPGHKAKALPTEPLCRYLELCSMYLKIHIRVGIRIMFFFLISPCKHIVGTH